MSCSCPTLTISSYLKFSLLQDKTQSGNQCEMAPPSLSAMAESSADPELLFMFCRHSSSSSYHIHVVSTVSSRASILEVEIGGRWRDWRHPAKVT
jgi:hypothetical protein